MLSRVWFLDPTTTEENAKTVGQPRTAWNGYYYASFGLEETRSWEDAKRYGFISAGGGRWYSNTLRMLAPGDRVLVYIPGHGYAGYCIVKEPVVKVDNFKVHIDGHELPITEAPVRAPQMFAKAGDEDLAEYLVRVDWKKTVRPEDAIKETGFFSIQHSVCRPRATSWNHTVERLKQYFPID